MAAANVRRVVIALSTALLALQMPIKASADGIGDVPPQPPVCDHLEFVNSRTDTTVNQITVGAGISCSRTIGNGTVTSGSGRTFQDWTDPPAENSPCYEERNVPVTFSSLNHPYEHYWRATLTSPDNIPIDTVTTDADVHEGRAYVSSVANQIGNHFITVLYTKEGIWRFQQQGDPRTGYCNGPWIAECQRIWRPEGIGTAVRDPCAQSLQYQPHPPDCVTACLPRTEIYNYLDQIVAGTHAGSIRTSPTQDRGLVNLPDCGWIEGANGTTQRQYVFTVAGPPDPTGRAIRYQYVVTLGPLSVEWNYDDPVQPGFQPGDFGQPWTQGGLCTNPHTYRNISDWNSNQRAHITAKETYGAWVNVVWWDGVTTHQYEIGELDRSFTVWATAEDQFIGQVEAIPTST